MHSAGSQGPQRSLPRPRQERSTAEGQLKVPVRGGSKPSESRSGEGVPGPGAPAGGALPSPASPDPCSCGRQVAAV